MIIITEITVKKKKNGPNTPWSDEFNFKNLDLIYFSGRSGRTHWTYMRYEWSDNWGVFYFLIINTCIVLYFIYVYTRISKLKLHD